MGLFEALVLGVIALVIFGDKLPTYAKEAARAMRQLRQMAQSAQNDLKAGLGPEFNDFDPRDLNPKNFVRKHLFEDDDPLGLKDFDKDFDDASSYANESSKRLLADERPPFDAEAT
ncbi:sec-independent translocase [Actinocorallia sp. API 0066]|uniref:sec-independent translocase n=1 Tax=Actinocorallia sp. API 0066 TaxID=2896846 RepID=UPI0027DF31BF|nr:sec-independent translocase [Actinocorallia sp. API 0066]